MSEPWAWGVVAGDGEPLEVEVEEEDARERCDRLSAWGHWPGVHVVPLYPLVTCDTCKHGASPEHKRRTGFGCMRPGPRYMGGPLCRCEEHEAKP